MTDDQTLMLAREADALMQNSALKQAFEGIESHYTQVWKGSGPSEYELREECHGQLFALAQLQRQLRSFVESGKILSAASGDEQNER